MASAFCSSPAIACAVRAMMRTLSPPSISRMRLVASQPSMTGIFLDLKMPVMDGWEATKRIREMDGGDSVRIIALTAQAMAGDEQKALAIGCDDYLAKPVVDPDLVRQKLERLIGAAA